MMRWWWFGPAATRDEIRRELGQMKAAGIGGVEIANLYAQALDDPATGFHNTPFLSPEHLAALRFAAEEARRLGLRVDVTLGSGWPFGGPAIPITQAAGKLRVERIAIAAGATEAPLPSMEAGEMLIEAYLVPVDAAPEELGHAQPIASPVAGRYRFAAAAVPRVLVEFLASRTGMTVKRPSVGADGFVLDHYDPKATATHLQAVGDKLLSAFGEHPPYAVFSDSLEVYGSDWTGNLLDEFARRRGYDLRPHLLALVADIGPETPAIRHDWGWTLTELADDGFLKPLDAWAHTHHTLLRSQTYGYPPVNLASNELVDLPEGEGKATFEMWREFSDTRWAASAGHLYHHPVISSETWTWLDSPAFRATPLDMKAEADLHFLQGINQLIGHGWPYSPPSAAEPGWRMYAAAALNAHNPWFFAMPDLAKYLQRVSYALRQGEPANDVALLLPDDDVWATFHAVATNPTRKGGASPTSVGGFDQSGSNVTIDESMDKALGKQVIAQVLDAGFNLDFVDADAVDQVGIPYRVLVLPGVDRLPVATYRKILAFAERGGIVVATGRLPASGPGLMHAAEEAAEIQQISQTLFHGSIATAAFVPDEAELGAKLASLLKPDMTLNPVTPEIGFLHRRLQEGNLYFVANTSNQPRRVEAKFRDRGKYAESWDAFTGNATRIDTPERIALELAPYESRLIFFSDRPSTNVPAAERWKQASPILDLSRDWEVSFDGTDTHRTMGGLESWTEIAAMEYFSGRAEYTREFRLANVAPEHRYLIDFGEGKPEPLPSPAGGPNMKAYLTPPIREAAEVYVNEKRVGVLWRPPWRLDITGYLEPGENHLRVVVGNTGVNAMAGQTPPDYRLLRQRYGTLFVPQGMDHLVPLPSGILGPVTLMEASAGK